MSGQRHLIRRQVLQITVADSAAAWRMQSRLSELQARQIEGLLDRCLTDLGDPNRLQRLDRVELDLGRLDLENLERDLLQKLDRALREQLGRLLRAEDSDAALAGEDVQVMARLELVLYFAETGNLPWWADTSRPRLLAEAIEFLRRRATRPLVVLMQTLARERGKLLRVILHCSDQQLTGVVGALVSSARPAVAAQELGLPALLAALLRVPATAVTSVPSGWRTCVYIGALRAACDEKSDDSGTRGFVRDALAQIAMDAGATYRALLTLLCQLGEAPTESSLPPAQLSILASLYQELPGVLRPAPAIAAIGPVMRPAATRGDSEQPSPDVEQDSLRTDRKQDAGDATAPDLPSSPNATPPASPAHTRVWEGQGVGWASKAPDGALRPSIHQASGEGQREGLIDADRPSPHRERERGRAAAAIETEPELEPELEPEPEPQPELELEPELVDPAQSRARKVRLARSPLAGSRLAKRVGGVGVSRDTPTSPAAFAATSPPAERDSHCFTSLHNFVPEPLEAEQEPEVELELGTQTDAARYQGETYQSARYQGATHHDATQSIADERPAQGAGQRNVSAETSQGVGRNTAPRLSANLNPPQPESPLPLAGEGQGEGALEPKAPSPHLSHERERSRSAQDQVTRIDAAAQDSATQANWAQPTTQPAEQADPSRETVDSTTWNEARPVAPRAARRSPAAGLGFSDIDPAQESPLDRRVEPTQPSTSPSNESDDSLQDQPPAPQAQIAATAAITPTTRSNLTSDGRLLTATTILAALRVPLQRARSPFSAVLAELHAALAPLPEHRRLLVIEPLRSLAQPYVNAGRAALPLPTAPDLLSALQQVCSTELLPAPARRRCLEALRQLSMQALQPEAPLALRRPTAPVGQQAAAPAVRRQTPVGADRRSPSSPNPKPRPVDLRYSDSDEVYVENAGLVILWPFLSSLFERLALFTDKRFKDRDSRYRAVGLLQHLATGEREPAEYQLALAKVLCGMPFHEVLEFGEPVTALEAEECASLLAAAIAHARILQDMPADEFRATFLQRKGVLGTQDGNWLLRVERTLNDGVLEQFPWTWNWVALPWLEAPLCVYWMQS